VVLEKGNRRRMRKGVVKWVSGWPMRLAFSPIGMEKERAEVVGCGFRLWVAGFGLWVAGFGCLVFGVEFICSRPHRAIYRGNILVVIRE
jgi:hypothetical protein